jgi:predicted RNA-binding Zn-ribbon protein involved in translation (DUF1610 family)
MEVEARTEEEACDIALDNAGNLYYFEKSSDYEVTSVCMDEEEAKMYVDKAKVNFVCPNCGSDKLVEIRSAHVKSRIIGANYGVEFDYTPTTDKDIGWDTSEWIRTECADCHYSIPGTDEDVIRWLFERGMLEVEEKVTYA